MAKLIPGDAVVTGAATLPATAAGPIELVVQQLQSDTLDACLEESATGSNGGIVVIHRVKAPQGDAEPTIFRVSLAMERAAP